MIFFVNKKNRKLIQKDGHYILELLGEENGCLSGCCSGISVYTTTEYLKPGIHKDQEGFFVLEGTGWAKIGNEEFRIKPEVSFLAPAGIKHSIKRDSDSVPLRIFWFHASV